MAQTIEMPDWHVVIQRDDTVGEKFKRAAISAAYPTQTMSSLRVAIWLHNNMDWKTGVVLRKTSIRALAQLTRLSTRSVQDGLELLVEAGLIKRAYMGKGRRASIQVSDRVATLEVGFHVYNLWPDEGQSVVDIATVTVAEPATLGHNVKCGNPYHASVADPTTQCSRSYYDNPIPLSPQAPQAAARSMSTDVSASTTERPLTSSPQHSWPVELNSTQPGIVRARVAGATKIEVAPATSRAQVADGTTPYGYGTEIAGLNGETSHWVDRLAKLEGGIVVDKSPSWVAVLEATRQTSPRRVQAAILDLERLSGQGKLNRRPGRALAGFARAIDEEEATARLEQTKPKPFRLNDHMGYGRR